MKRHSALQTLSREHHGALVLALACTRAASSGSDEKIRAACERVVHQFETDLEPHFRQGGGSSASTAAGRRSGRTGAPHAG